MLLPQQVQVRIWGESVFAKNRKEGEILLTIVLRARTSIGKNSDDNQAVFPIPKEKKAT